MLLQIKFRFLLLLLLLSDKVRNTCALALHSYLPNENTPPSSRDYNARVQPHHPSGYYVSFLRAVATNVLISLGK